MTTKQAIINLGNAIGAALGAAVILAWRSRAIADALV